MRKLRLFLYCLFLGLLFSPVYSQCGSFSDGFESGNWSPTWSNVSGTYTRNVITTNPAVGTYCLQQSGSGGHASGLVAVFPSSQPSTISWRVRYDATTASGAYFVCGDATTTGSNCVTFCYINSGANVRFYSATGLNTPSVANTWYHVEMRNINWVNRTYDIYIDGVLRQSAWPFRTSTMTSMDRIYLYNIASMTAYYDEILVDGAPVSLNPVLTNPNCGGDSTGVVAVAPTGGTPQYSYQWSTGDTAAMVSNLPAGSYSVMVTDSVGCTATDTLLVTEPPVLGDSLSFTEPVCNGEANGSIDLTAYGGTPGLSYLWSNGDTTQDLSNLAAGIYSVVITDSLGCSLEDSVQLNQPAAVTAMLTVTNPLCNGDTNGAIDLTAMGGTPGYAYQWGTGDSTANISGLSPGWYAVTLTDSLGCTGMDSAEVTEPAALSSSGTITDEITPPGNNGAIDLTVAGGTPGYTFLWNTAATSEDLSGLAAGTYSVEITDSNGCTWVDTFVVSSIVGLANEMTEWGISAYPNPGNGRFHIEVSLPASLPMKLTVVDLHGRVVRQQQLQLPAGDSKFELDLNREPNGVYLLHLQTEQSSQHLKLIKH